MKKLNRFQRAVLRRWNIENPSTPLEEIGEVDDENFTSRIVTPKNAMKVPAIWCAVNFISDTVAGLPISVHKLEDNGYYEVAHETRIHRILNRAPSPTVQPFKWLAAMMSDVLLYGIGLSWIERDKRANNQIVNIWNIDQNNLTINKDKNGELLYTITNELGTNPITYNEREVIDIRFFPKAKREVVISPIKELRESIRLSLNLNDFASDNFQNGGAPRGVITGKTDTAKGMQKMMIQVKEAIRLANKISNGIIPLPPNHDLKVYGANASDAQMHESRRFQVEETARLYQIPPIFLQDLTKGTYQNTEQAARTVIIHTIRRYLKQIEGELNLKCWGRSVVTYETRFDETDLTRGDNKNRIEGQARQVQTALRTPNEVRAQDNYPPKPGGDQLLRQVQLQPLEDTPKDEPDDEPEPDSDPEE